MSVLALFACSGDDSGSSNSTPSSDAAVTEAPSTEAPVVTEAPFAITPPALNDVGATTVEGPITGGAGQVVFGTSAFDGSAFGYVEEEYFIGGTATGYTSATPLSEDGLWDLTPKDTADYRTRILVRRPANAADFDGTVYVEWLNVTAGLDTGPTWSLSWIEMIRQGATWVGVSTQRVGVEGGGNPMGEFRVLKKADPERYGSLNHPGDNYSYDIFSQAGATVWRQADTILGGLQPEAVIAVGESQSGFRMASYLNGFAPMHDVYNGYLVHSRGSRAANIYCATNCVDPVDPSDVATPAVVRIREDLTRPVLNFVTETDVVGDRLGYRRAEQPDTDVFRNWEVAGTAHGDAYSLGINDGEKGDGAADEELFAAQFGAPTSVYMGIIECSLPINAGPHTYVLRSAIRSLDSWIRTGVAPASMPKLQNNADITGYETDANGVALGGIRTPYVDVPLAVLSGLGQDGGGFCGLFGTTLSLSAEQLDALYPTAEDFLAKWNESTDAAVASGAILAIDGEAIKAAAAARYEAIRAAS
ncbi:MAG: alpha/beta hydrolase domain-containing protein [Ilumatobacteraceae bacterium]